MHDASLQFYPNDKLPCMLGIWQDRQAETAGFCSMFLICSCIRRRSMLADPRRSRSRASLRHALRSETCKTDRPYPPSLKSSPAPLAAERGPVRAGRAAHRQCAVVGGAGCTGAGAAGRRAAIAMPGNMACGQHGSGRSSTICARPAPPRSDRW